MKKRNWLDLARKLVDRFDMDYTVGALQEALGEASLSFFGEGVLPTTIYPNPFPITMSGVALGGSVGSGIGYDPQGQITRIDPSSPSGQKNFTITAADPSLDRWDLLVIRYKMTGQTAIPKPSDPIQTVFLNKIDDFELAVLPGTLSATPSYPAKGTLDIILAGLRVHAGDTLGTQVTVDLVPREIATPFALTKPVFKAEVPTGVIDGLNNSYALSLVPMNAQSVIVSLDALAIPTTDWTLVGQNVVFNTPPVPGQQPYVWYIVESPMSQNPLAGQQEVPSGSIDGINDTFSLSGHPADKVSLFVFLDGMFLPQNEWAFEQGSLVDKIIFNDPPAPGQTINVFYFVNPATVGVAPGGGGGGGGGDGALVTYGTEAVPLTITAGAGIGISADQRQMRFVKSGGGQVTITANPQIQPGSVVGQEMVLTGTSATDYITLNDGNGLKLNGPVNLTNENSILLFWTGSVWREVSRV